MSNKILSADDFKGVFAGTTPDLAKLAELEVAYRDAMKTAVAEQGKSLQPDILAQIRGPQGDSMQSVQSALQEIQKAVATLDPELTKDWNLTSPLSTGLVPFDLEAPSKKMFPVLSPLRNKLARSRGQGTSRRAKRITAISGSGQSKAAVRPFHSSSSQVAFAGVNLQRPPKIDYAADDMTVTYRLQGLSDSVDWKAYWAGSGFEDIRELSNTILLKAMFLAEERALMGGRSTDAGLSGAFTAPTITLATRAPAAGETGITGTGAGGTNIYVEASAEAIFGEGVSSANVSINIAQSSVLVVDVSISVESQGALGYRIYANKADTGGADPGDATRRFQGRTGYKTFTIQGGSAFATTGAVPSADTSASAEDYDGILSQLGMAGVPGYYKRLNGKFSTDLREIQASFAGLWDSHKADPEEAWMNGADRRDLGTIILGNSNTLAYRLAISSQGDVTAGAVVASLFNQVTGKEVAVTVHPWLPQGNVPIVSYSMPYPSTEIPNVMEVVNVQDYFSVQWPTIQNSFDASIYLYGALVFYAPLTCGFLQGVQPQ